MPIIRNRGSLIFGYRVNLRCDGDRVRFEIGRDATVMLGDKAFLNSGVKLISEVGIQIGAHCRIGPSCVISDTNNHPIDEGQPVKNRPIKVGDNVWLGRGVIVLPGVTIGANSVLGAGSVVNRDIPANQMWSGNPAVFRRDVIAPPGWVRP